jgi:RecA/RadA recombinase
LDPNYCVIYLDTSSNYTVERFSQLYKSQYWSKIIPIADYLNRLFVFKIVDIYDLFMTIYYLETKFLSSLKVTDSLETKLIIIDNVASPFRSYTEPTLQKRIKLINKFGKDLRRLSAKFNCAILTVNQMTTKIVVSSNPINSDKSKLKSNYKIVPSLGIEIFMN